MSLSQSLFLVLMPLTFCIRKPSKGGNGSTLLIGLTETLGCISLDGKGLKLWVGLAVSREFMVMGYSFSWDACSPEANDG